MNLGFTGHTIPHHQISSSQSFIVSNRILPLPKRVYYRHNRRNIERKKRNIITCDSSVCVFFRREELSNLSIFYVAEIQTKSPATPSSSPGEGWEGVRCRLFASLQKLGHTRVCYHLHGYCGVSTVRHPCSVAQTVRNSTHYYLFTVTTVKLMQVSVCQCIYMCKETETERDRQRDTETHTEKDRC